MQTGLSIARAGTGNRPLNDARLALPPILGVSLSSLGLNTQHTGPPP